MGRLLPVQNLPRPIQVPARNTALAEFVGIMIGDGGMSEYQAMITLHSTNETEYVRFIVSLIERLFKVTPHIQYRNDKQALSIVISRKNVVSFLHICGLHIGNKLNQGLDIPYWIKVNREFCIVCVRGLIDTDGSVFTHRYLSKGRMYSYKKMGFTSASPDLIESVMHVLTDLGIRSRVSASGKDVRIDGVNDVEKYFSIIGTNNPKHLRRYRS